MFLIDDILIYAGAAVLGGLLGAAIAAYIEDAINWFRNFWNTHETIRKNGKAIGALIKYGYKVVKRIFVEKSNGEEEEYYQEDDEGEEISNLDLPSEAEESLKENGYLIVETYGF